MKILNFKKNHNRGYQAVYQKKCPCCGRTFRATYSSTDYNLYQTAKDIVDSHYNAHTLCCLSSAKYRDIIA